MTWATEHDPAGCSKRPDFTPTQPRRAKTRRSASRRTTRLPFPSFFSIRLRRWGGFMRGEMHVLLFKGEMDNQKNHPYADRRIGDIEGRPMVGVHIDICLLYTS